MKMNCIVWYMRHDIRRLEWSQCNDPVRPLYFPDLISNPMSKSLVMCELNQSEYFQVIVQRENINTF